jgi:hypothetical protein
MTIQSLSHGTLNDVKNWRKSPLFWEILIDRHSYETARAHVQQIVLPGHVPISRKMNFFHRERECDVQLNMAINGSAMSLRVSHDHRALGAGDPQ